jgi:hypothetical protein
MSPLFFAVGASSRYFSKYSIACLVFPPLEAAVPAIWKAFALSVSYLADSRAAAMASSYFFALRAAAAVLFSAKEQKSE